MVTWTKKFETWNSFFTRFILDKFFPAKPIFPLDVLSLKYKFVKFVILFLKFCWPYSYTKQDLTIKLETRPTSKPVVLNLYRA